MISMRYKRWVCKLVSGFLLLTGSYHALAIEQKPYHYEFQCEDEEKGERDTREYSDGYDGYSGVVDVVIENNTITIHHNQKLLLSESINTESVEIYVLEHELGAHGKYVDVGVWKAKGINEQASEVEFEIARVGSSRYEMKIYVPNFIPGAEGELAMDMLWCKDTSMADEFFDNMVDYLIKQDVSLGPQPKEYLEKKKAQK